MHSTFTTDATIAVIADWIEFDHIISGRNRTTESRLTRADRAVNDELDHGVEIDSETGERLETEILDSRLEERNQRVWDELSRRQAVLRDSYPFILEPTRSGWRLSSRHASRSTRVPHSAYIATLLIASFRHHHIVSRDNDPAPWVTLEKQIAKTFQLLAVLAANNIFGPGTEVYWFGSPRPDQSGFRAALPKLVAAIGLGQLKSVAPYNTDGDKDATVDLVAWRTFADRAYGALVLYGQVASGNNWTSKPIYTHLGERFFDHFQDSPASKFLGATFMPFLLHTDTKVPRDGNMQGAIRDKARALEQTHGIIVDRLRLVELIGHGFENSGPRYSTPTLAAAARDVVSWIRGTRSYCAGPPQ